MYSFCSSVIFVIPVRHTFQSYPREFGGIDNTSIVGLVFPNIAAGFSTAIYWCFTRHCCWHRNFQLSTSIFHGMFKFFIIWFNEENTTLSSGIIELRFLDGPSLLYFAFSLHRTYASTYLATHCRVLRSFVSLVSLPRTMKIHQAVPFIQ